MTPGGLALPPKPRRAPKKRPKIHAADIPDVVLPHDGDAFINAARKAAHTRTKGQPSYALIMTVLLYIYHLMTIGQRKTLIEIGNACDCSDESVRRVLLFIEPHGVLGTINVLVRVGRNLWRGANLYVAPWCVKADALRLPRRVAERAANFVVECGRLLGLYARPLGLNTSPLKPQPGFT
jgi:hypothetical protein